MYECPKIKINAAVIARFSTKKYYWFEQLLVGMEGKDVGREVEMVWLVVGVSQQGGIQHFVCILSLFAVLGTAKHYEWNK